MAVRIGPRASIRRQSSAAGGRVFLADRCPGTGTGPQCCPAPGAPTSAAHPRGLPSQCCWGLRIGHVPRAQPWSSSRGVRGVCPRSLVFRTQHSLFASMSSLDPRTRSGIGSRGLWGRDPELCEPAGWGQVVRSPQQAGEPVSAALPFLSGRFCFISLCGKNGIKWLWDLRVCKS